jgi:hypothetical protein
MAVKYVDEKNCGAVGSLVLLMQIPEEMEIIKF